MAYEQKEGQGSLFPNDRKEKDTHPDWKGEIKINGKLYWLSGWDKKGGRGGGFISISIGDEKKPRGEGQSQGRSTRPTSNTPPATTDSNEPPF